MSKGLVVVILAAGKGKRMANPDFPKVMVSLAGRPMLCRVMATVKSIRPERIIVVVGHHKELVMEYVTREFGENIEFAEQKEQLGTGHAVLQTQALLEQFDGDILILSGDVPLLKKIPWKI